MVTWDRSCPPPAGRDCVSHGGTRNDQGRGEEQRRGVGVRMAPKPDWTLPSRICYLPLLGMPKQYTLLIAVLVWYAGAVAHQGIAPVLVFPPGARHAALGEAGVALLDRGFACYYNPALPGFSFQDGVAFVEHRLFAVADRSIGDWYCHEQGQHWQIMVIRPA